MTVEKTEPDLYGEVQTVELIEHTGHSTPARAGGSAPRKPMTA